MHPIKPNWIFLPPAHWLISKLIGSLFSRLLKYFGLAPSHCLKCRLSWTIQFQPSKNRNTKLWTRKHPLWRGKEATHKHPHSAGAAWIIQWMFSLTNELMNPPCIEQTQSPDFMSKVPLVFKRSKKQVFSLYENVKLQINLKISCTRFVNKLFMLCTVNAQKTENKLIFVIVN